VQHSKRLTLREERHRQRRGFQNDRRQMLWNHINHRRRNIEHATEALDTVQSWLWGIQQPLWNIRHVCIFLLVSWPQA
jgi:hypothetical protein